MNEIGFNVQLVEGSFTMSGIMRDAKATRLGLSKHKLTGTLACGGNPVITVTGMHRDVRFSRRGDYGK